jgi:hypothetical protein
LYEFAAVVDMQQHVGRRFRHQQIGVFVLHVAEITSPDGEDDMTDYRQASAMACRRCAAKPGNPCVNAYGSRMPLLHPCRWRAAAGKKARDWDRAAPNSQPFDGGDVRQIIGLDPGDGNGWRRRNRNDLSRW